MTGLAALQRQMAAALLSDTPPDGLLAALRPGTPPPERRLAVYRNNIRTSLTEALAANFPVTAALVGEAFFQHLTHRFIPDHPPRQASLAAYGLELPEMLADHPGLADHPAIIATARFEAALLDALTAPPCPPLAPESFAAAAATGQDMVFTPHPAVRRLSLAHPADLIWQAHQPGGPALEDVQTDEAVELVLTRPALTVQWVRLTDVERPCLDALLTGQPLSQAAGLLGEGGDLARLLLQALTLGLFCAITPHSES